MLTLVLLLLLSMLVLMPLWPLLLLLLIPMVIVMVMVGGDDAATPCIVSADRADADATPPVRGTASLPRRWRGRQLGQTRSVTPSIKLSVKPRRRGTRKRQPLLLSFPTLRRPRKAETSSWELPPPGLP